jgi:hypothetical protein
MKYKESIIKEGLYGNTAGNSVNNGLVATQGDWAYYSNGYSLNKIRTDGTDRQFVE